MESRKKKPTRGVRTRVTRRRTLERVFTASEKSQLWMVNFRRIKLDDVDFRGANLKRARFDQVSLSGCDFQGADLSEARFVKCDLRRARFDGATLSDNRFDGSWLTGATGLSAAQKRYVEERGGSFLRTVAARARSR